MILPVQEILRHPCTAARAIHVISAIVIKENGDISGCDTVLTYGHRKRVAIALSPGSGTNQQCRQGNDQESSFHFQ
jgi:hypothetical protein